MKDNEYREMKQEFDRLVEKRDRLKLVNEQMYKLGKNVDNREYKKLAMRYEIGTSNILDDDIDKKSDYDLVKRVVRYNKITPTTNIYFYIGTAIKDKDGDIDIIDEKKEDAEYYKFYNIEESGSSRYVSVISSNIMDFTARNIVIYPTTLYNCELCFDKARSEFFMTAFMEGQDEAVEKFKKYSNNGYPWHPLL